MKFRGLISISILSALFACNTQPVNEEGGKKIDQTEQCYIHFYIVDNQAKIYVDGDLVHDTNPISHHVSSERKVSLTEFIKPGKHDIKIELFNAMPGDIYDKYWEIYYEIFVNGTPVDYIHEMEKNGKQGLVWSEEHEIVISE